MTNKLKIEVAGRILPSEARNPAGAVAGEARFLDCDTILAVGDGGKKLAEWRTPLCPWTRRKLRERILRLHEAIGDKDPLVSQGLYLVANLIEYGTLIPPGATLIGERGTLDQFRILNEEDLHGRSKEAEDAGSPEPGPLAG